MSLCHEYGMPYSTWRAWSPEDRDLALAYLEYRGTICQSCGTNPKDWLDERGELVEPLPYRARSTKCHGCVTLEEARANIGSEKNDRSITQSLHRVPRAQGERELRQWQMKQ